MSGMARTECRAAKISGKMSVTRGEALGGQLAQAGEEAALCGVDADADEEERVHEMHPSVRGNAYECDAL